MALPGELTAAEFPDAFPELFTREAFRLETLDYYHDPLALRLLPGFLAGEGLDSTERAEWLNFIRDVHSSGRRMSRVHVLGPLNDYLRYELACYERNAEAGEDIRIMARELGTRLGLPPFDFWLFDSSMVAVMIYDDLGVWHRAELSSDPVFVRLCCGWRDTALSNATPLHDYQSRRTAA